MMMGVLAGRAAIIRVTTAVTNEKRYALLYKYKYVLPNILLL